MLVSENLGRPFLKWAGGKKWLVQHINALLPRDFSGSYYEPFVGAGIFYFTLCPNRALLSDLNEDLIKTYEAIKTDPDLVINMLEKYPYDSDFYYSMRARKPRSLHGHAARLIYLNRTCWNGLYRVNRKGEFNVPFGRHKNPRICDADNLRNVSLVLQNTKLLSADFEQAVQKAKSGSLVYFDPPYITGHQNNGFHMYNNRLFAWSDQERLARVAFALSSRGVFVLVSNADHANIRELYPDFYKYRITRKSLIGGLNSSRGDITESLFSNYPLEGLEAEII